MSFQRLRMVGATQYPTFVHLCSHAHAPKRANNTSSSSLQSLLLIMLVINLSRVDASAFLAKRRGEVLLSGARVLDKTVDDFFTFLYRSSVGDDEGLLVFLPACLRHVEALLGSIDRSYTDIHLTTVLQNECALDKEFPLSREDGFEKTEVCLKYAARLAEAREDNLRSGASLGYREFCEDVYYEDAQRRDEERNTFQRRSEASVWWYASLIFGFLCVCVFGCFLCCCCWLHGKREQTACVKDDVLAVTAAVAQARAPPPPPLPDEAEARLREVFVSCDAGGDGKVNKRELILACRKSESIATFFGLPVHIRQEDGSRDAMEALFQGMDVNSDHEVTWVEFKNFFQQRMSGSL